MMMRRHTQSGVGLVNLLVAILLFSLGVLGLGGMYVRMTSVATQNQNITQMAGWSNAIWGVIQANPTVLVTLNSLGTKTYQLSNYTTAPAPLQPLLSQIFVNAGPSNDSLVRPLSNALPGSTATPSSVTFTPGGDTASLATACNASNATVLAATTACTLKMDIKWLQTGKDLANGVATRTQTFYYQFGF